MVLGDGGCAGNDADEPDALVRRKLETSARGAAARVRSPATHFTHCPYPCGTRAGSLAPCLVFVPPLAQYRPADMVIAGAVHALVRRGRLAGVLQQPHLAKVRVEVNARAAEVDRKSTRLNSSHL